MKNTLFALFVALLMVGCGDGNVDYYDLEDRNGVKYLPNEETPFTGRAESFWRNGQKQLESNFKDGKEDGLWTSGYRNGHKELESNWKDNKKQGLCIDYNEDGTEYRRLIYKDGEIVD